MKVKRQTFRLWIFLTVRYQWSTHVKKSLIVSHGVLFKPAQSNQNKKILKQRRRQARGRSLPSHRLGAARIFTAVGFPCCGEGSQSGTARMRRASSFQKGPPTINPLSTHCTMIGREQRLMCIVVKRDKNCQWYIHTEHMPLY